MKLYLSITCAFFACFTTLAQKPPGTKPFIIQGQLANLKEKDLIFFFRDPKKGLKDHKIENVTADSTGRFYLKTYGITAPTMATLRKGALSVDVYAAPGYDLTVTGDVKDVRSFMLQKKISGIGAEANRYLLEQDIALYAARDSVGWYEMREKDLLKFVKKDKRLRDSVYFEVFGKKNVKDKWFSHFAKMTRLNNEFLNAYYLLNLVTYDSSFSYDRAKAFLAEHVDKNLWANLYNEENLLAENYISWFMGTYPEFLKKQATRKNPDYGKGVDHDIQLVGEMATHYKGRIREIKMFTKMSGIVTYCRSFEAMSEYKEKLPKYIALLKSPGDRAQLEEKIVEKEAELLKAQIGKPAPLFEAADSSGVVHKLSDYSGKVVYLDLWASWCGPCRAEVPYFKTITEKYKNNRDVAFISVAVSDKPDKWRGALIKDQPQGLQLYDTHGAVLKSYFASSIPKFILINKKGEIVSFDAPAPSNEKALTEILNVEIGK